MSRADNKEKYKEYDHQYYIKHKRPKSKIGQAEQQISDLEAKFAESEKQRQHLKDWLDNEILTSVDHESYYATINEYEEEVKKLKQQLAEKDRQLKLAEELLIKQEKEYDEQLEKQASIHYRHLKEKDQDKISFAVEQLELARRRIDRLGYNENKCLNKKDCVEDCLEEIDNQINELKEGVKNE